MDKSERISLGLSAALHGLLIAVLALGLLHWTAPAPITPPSIEVALTDTIALESRAASHEAPQVAQAPELGPVEPDTPPPAQATIAPEPKPVVKPVTKPEPPKPAKPDLAKAMAKLPAGKTASGATATGQTGRPRASRLGDDFLTGLDSPAKSNAKTVTASGPAPLSAEAARALSAEIRRQLKPYWRAPTGVDADKLVTMLRWRLNPDGTLAAGPTLVSQTGKTASNQPQQQLHIEAATRAVRAAMPFHLPDDYYENWKLIEFSFDKRL